MAEWQKEWQNDGMAEWQKEWQNDGMAEWQKEWQNGQMAGMATYVLFMIHTDTNTDTFQHIPANPTKSVTL